MSTLARKIPRCDKCNGIVFPSDDAALLDAIYRGDLKARAVYGNRHIQRQRLDGKLVCEGSPSRRLKIISDNGWYSASQRMEKMFAAKIAA